jgi:hypothetical protein
MGMAPVRTLPPAFGVAPVGGNVRALDRIEDVRENARVRDDHEGRNGSETETEGVVHRTNTLTYNTHSRHMTQNGDAASDGNGEHHQLPLYRTHRFNSLAAIPR